MKFILQKVYYMPKQLLPGILYYSEEFGAAAHLCACGCGEKIRTPIGVTEWAITETKEGPTLSPSVGNWQKGCQSHYFISRGSIIWGKKWTEEEILKGRKKEEKRRKVYYDDLNTKRGASWKLSRLFKNIFK